MRQKIAREPFPEKIRKVGQLVRLVKSRPGTFDCEMKITQDLRKYSAAQCIAGEGAVIVSRSITIGDNDKSTALRRASIINGAQTMGVLQDYFRDHPDDQDFPFVNFEIIVTDNEELIGDISIAAFLPRILTGFHHSAQGWTATRDYPG